MKNCDCEAVNVYSEMFMSIYIFVPALYMYNGRSRIASPGTVGPDRGDGGVFQFRTKVWLSAEVIF